MSSAAPPLPEAASEEAVRAYAAQREKLRRRYRRRLRGLQGVLGVLLLTVVAIQIVTPPPNLVLLALWFTLISSVVVVVVGVVMSRRMKRWTAKTATEMLREDGRPPILYLRAFDVDRSLVWYERRVAAAFKRLGPLVGLGRPTEKLPVASYAARDYLIGDWQKRIVELVGGARFVVVYIGTTSNLVWELEQLTRIGDPQRIILCLPREPLFSLSHTRSVLGLSPNPVAQYEAFRESLGDLFPGGLPAEVRRSAFVTFGPDWEPISSAELTRQLETNAEGQSLRRLHRRLRRPRFAAFTLIP